MREHIMIVDGYNVIGNWPELAKLKAEDHFDVARDRLLDILAEYRSHENAKMIVVFDAMYVPGIGKSYAKWDLQVVFTKEDETADSYIERLAQDMNSPLVQLVVVTSDQAEQWTVFSRGALRISSRDFLKEVQRSDREFNHDTAKLRRPSRPAQQSVEQRPAILARQNATAFGATAEAERVAMRMTQPSQI